ncbi:hypothetical protein DVK05_01240 [Halorubrum sp. Atlit-8R]|nr:hypothetical protein DVK06_12490 [Halorubrum sp. Atlit-28R]RLM71402.1 hypothetical protein DVK08_04525 [Halorubrum sp. Atlit-9R]RLM82445.1 hypothetical protein DVK05_01240 [Halorubrum sp. Atlit-8R]
MNATRVPWFVVSRSSLATKFRCSSTVYGAPDGTFSRSGFNRSVKEAADERDAVRLFDLSEIVSVLESTPDE